MDDYIVNKRDRVKVARRKPARTSITAILSGWGAFCLVIRRLAKRG